MRRGHSAAAGLSAASAVTLSPSHLCPPAGKWHVGAKRLFELFPGGLKKRIRAERRKHWDQHQNAAVTAAAAAVAAFERQHSKLSTEQAKELEELQLRLSLLQGMQEKLDDLGENGGPLRAFPGNLTSSTKRCTPHIIASMTLVAIGVGASTDFSKAAVLQKPPDLHLDVSLSAQVR